MLRVAPLAIVADPAQTYLRVPTNVVVPPLRLSCAPLSRFFVPSVSMRAPPALRFTAVWSTPLSQVNPALLTVRAEPLSVPAENANVPVPPTVPPPAPSVTMLVLAGVPKLTTPRVNVPPVTLRVPTLRTPLVWLNAPAERLTVPTVKVLPAPRLLSRVAVPALVVRLLAACGELTVTVYALPWFGAGSRPRVTSSRAPGVVPDDQEDGFVQLALVGPVQKIESARAGAAASAAAASARKAARGERRMWRHLVRVQGSTDGDVVRGLKSRAGLSRRQIRTGGRSRGRGIGCPAGREGERAGTWAGHPAG